MRSRAFRRHTEKKKKNWARKAWKEWHSTDPSGKQIGHLAHSPAMCSCHMCGNPRKYFNEKTMQERRQDHALVAQLAEATDSNPVKYRFESDQGYQ